VNSTTAAQPVFMTCPGSVNVLSMGNTLRRITFFSALKKFTSCHKMAGTKIPMALLCTTRTNVSAYLCTPLPHTHTHTYVTAHRPTGTHVHTYIHRHTNTHAYTSDKSHNQCKNNKKFSANVKKGTTRGINGQMKERREH